MANKGMYSDMDLEMYVPDVYQPDVYKIDYEKLKEKGIKLITFDLDDTLVPKSTGKMPDPLQPHITIWKEMGFKIMLLSNGNEKKVQRFAEKLDVKYIAEAEKPAGRPFQKALDMWKKEGIQIEKSQMAHVGNSIMKDIAGAKASRITTCLIRYVGKQKKTSFWLTKSLNRN